MNVFDVLNKDNLIKQNEVTIIGLEFLDDDGFKKLKKIFLDILKENLNYKFNIYYFNTTSEFISTILDDRIKNVNEFKRNRIVRKRVIGTRNEKINSFIEDILVQFKNMILYGNLENIPNNYVDIIIENFFIRQINLPQTFSAVRIGNSIWWSPKIKFLSTVDRYEKIEENSIFYDEIIEYIDNLKDIKKTKKYLSEIGTEIISAYVKEQNENGYEHFYRKMEVPRSAFENELRYRRYSVWLFIFNRKGDLLLHQRSHLAKDNCLLWDKSAGGHYNLEDASTEITAKKELIEELFSEKAEYGEYQLSDLAKVTSFGEWKPNARPSRTFTNAFDGLPQDNVIMFRGIKDNNPWTEGENPSERKKSKIKKLDEYEIVNRGEYEISLQKVHEESLPNVQTWFISDVYFCIAPEGVIDTEKQMYDKLHRVYAEGAAYDHKIISIFDLKQWIEEEKANGTAKQKFTNDLLYVMDRYYSELEEFSIFVQNVFKDSLGDK